MAGRLLDTGTRPTAPENQFPSKSATLRSKGQFVQTFSPCCMCERLHTRLQPKICHKPCVQCPIGGFSLNEAWMPRRKGVPNGKCAVCAHPERGRIDYLLIATAGEIGGGRKSLAGKFGLSEAALYRHRAKHITPGFKAAVRVGPLESEERLRRLSAETSTSVLERYNALYNGHLTRWLNALEAGNDQAMVWHGRLMGDMLNRVALLTKELVPAGTHIENNLYLAPDFISFQQRAVKVLRRHPEALQDWLADFNPRPEPKLIEAAQ